MTPDHANTVRDALRFYYARDIWRTPQERIAALAALDALLAQAERWQEIEHPFDQSEYDAMFARAQTAEAERDRLQAKLNYAIRHRLQIADVKAERDHARDALLWVAETYPKVMREMPTELFQPLRAALGNKPA